MHYATTLFQFQNNQYSIALLVDKHKNKKQLEEDKTAAVNAAFNALSTSASANTMIGERIARRSK